MHTDYTKHPTSLRIFFATEMWERYGFYVVQSLLALYLALYFKWPDHTVYQLVGSFTALTYLSPIVGGWIADHLLGQKRAILAGAIVLFFSYLILGLLTSDAGLTAALAGIAVGTGLLKPNISSLLGNEYAIDSPKRERGFTIFYMGITTGIILGTTIPSLLHTHFGWPIAFMSGAVGIIIAIITFSFGIYYYQIKDYTLFVFYPFKILRALLLTGLLWLSAFYILECPLFADYAFAAVIILSLAYLTNCSLRETKQQAKHTLVIGVLCTISVMFWAFYFQMFMSLTLFISRVVEPSLFGINFPPPYYIGIQSTGIILFGFVLAYGHNHFTIKESALRASKKFLLAIAFITGAYLLITSICYTHAGTRLLSPLYFIPAYLLISIAELLISPIGLSAITVLASRKKVSTMVGIFLVSLGIGGFLSGKLSNLTAIENPASLTISQLTQQYTTSFMWLSAILLTAFALSYLLYIVIKKLLD